MGFFSSYSDSNNFRMNNSTPFEEEYVRRTIRSSSKTSVYQNDAFNKRFNQIEEVLEEADVVNAKPTRPERKRFRLRDLFKKKSKVGEKDDELENDKENITPPVTDDYYDAMEDFTHGDISIGNDVDNSVFQSKNFKIFEDDNSSLQISAFLDLPKRRKTIRNLFRKSKQDNNVDDGIEGDVTVGTILTKKSTFSLKQRLFRRKTLDLTDSNQDFLPHEPASSVYEVEETLTQKYMGGNYESLMNDIDSIPFDLTVKEDINSMHHKITQAVQALSPKKSFQQQEIERANSLKFKSQKQVETCMELNNWNPYEAAKKVREIDAISLNSRDYELAEKYNVKIGKQRPSRIGTFVRRLTTRRYSKRSDIDITNSKTLNNSSDTVNFMGDQSTFRFNASTMKKRQPLGNFKPQEVKGFSSDLFHDDQRASGCNSAETETIIGDNKDSFKALKTNISHNNFSGSTDVGTAETKFPQTDSDSLVTTTKNSKFSKEQTKSGNVNFYHEISVLPVQLDKNDENIYKDILPKEYRLNEQGLSQKKLEGFKTIRRSNSVSRFADEIKPLKPIHRTKSLNDGKYETLKRPHTSSISQTRNENNSDNRSILTANQSVYSENAQFTWNFKDLEIESEIENERSEKEKEFENLKLLIRKNKIRQREHFSSGGSIW